MKRHGVFHSLQHLRAMVGRCSCRVCRRVQGACPSPVRVRDSACGGMMLHPCATRRHSSRELITFRQHVQAVWRASTEQVLASMKPACAFSRTVQGACPSRPSGEDPACGGMMLHPCATQVIKCEPWPPSQQLWWSMFMMFHFRAYAPSMELSRELVACLYRAPLARLASCLQTGARHCRT
jgi:hypothetical protein